MLPRLQSAPLRDDGWLFKRKLNGQRLLAVSLHATVRLITRNGLDRTAAYRSLAQTFPTGRGYAIDGEAVAFRGGRHDFSLLQHRMHRRVDAADAPPAHFIAFDIVNLDGRDLTALPFTERRRLLRDPPLAARVPVNPVVQGESAHLWRSACDAGWEGLIAKRADSRYRSGRSDAWRKRKCIKGQEFVVVGYKPPKGGRSRFGALLLGYYDDGHIRYAGKVGTGFDQYALDDLHARMQGLRRAAPPVVDPPTGPATWTDPKLVCRVDFTEWTPDGKVRRPRYPGLRDDKKPREVVRET